MLRLAIRKLDELAVAMIVEQPTDLPRAGCLVEMIDAGLLGERYPLDQIVFDLMDDRLGSRRIEILDRAERPASIDLLANSQRCILPPGRPNEH
ncbi:hypothetical protein HKX06_03995 [Sphingomonas paucimobilis]|uniref:Uncharacterized protein n=1 Tax=Sphingomonas paucimobilis TaxID=13689 RepID=A0A7Y2PC97_SPHPI|nr:hypothetical protein [Sphingomonas paucimobilis]